MGLTDVKIKALKPKDARYMVRDDACLYLEVLPSGTKSWKYRYSVDGKAVKVTIGQYPAVSLADARIECAKMTDTRAKSGGVLPVIKAGLSFKEVTLTWFEGHKEGKAAQYASDMLARLTRHVFPHIGNKSIADVTAPDVLTVVKIIENAGHISLAHTVHGVIGQVFRYAIANGLTGSVNPADAIRGALQPENVKHHASLTDVNDITRLLHSMDSYDENGLVVYSALWFSAYTFLRPGEVRHLEWREVNFTDATIRIAAEKMKLRRVHIVPMARQVVALLERLRPITGHGRYVFPCSRAADGSRPMSENAVNAALRYMGYARGEMTAHGFRSMASTRLNEMRYHPDVIERQLAHVDGNGVRAAYNYAEYLSERVEMMQNWADWLDGLLVKNAEKIA